MESSGKEVTWNDISAENKKNTVKLFYRPLQKDSPPPGHSI